MAETVYLLGALASLACSLLLLRAYARARRRLLLWSGVCFLGLAGNNVLLFADKIVFPDYNLGTTRSLTAVAAIGVMIYGLVWDSK